MLLDNFTLIFCVLATSYFVFKKLAPQQIELLISSENVLETSETYLKCYEIYFD